MKIQEALVAHLGESAAVSAVVGNRLYPKILPQSPVFPAIVIDLLSADRAHSQDGSSGFATAVFQFSCLATTAGAAKELADKVAIALTGYRGSMASGVNVEGVFDEDESDNYDDTLELYSTERVFTVQFLE